MVGQSRKAKTDQGKRPPKLSLWVPAYYYPNGPGLREWDRLIAAARLVPIVAIANPASGPGDHVDGLPSYWDAEVEAVRGANQPARR